MKADRDMDMVIGGDKQVVASSSKQELYNKVVGLVEDFLNDASVDAEDKDSLLYDLMDSLTSFTDEIKDRRQDG